MIDHVSVGVRSLGEAERFYEAVLGALGYAKLVMRPATIGFGRRYAEFWINLRPAMAGDRDGGAHVCLRARSQDEVHRFHAAALAHGGADDGAPGPRQHDDPGRIYYAAFVRDPDGNRIEAVCFLEG
ncbi:MAG TPA: VOC family protein [Beijerinckiaceae bacterium]|nr:VOC family protein [Beijerinckiaceae bacterium]